MCPYDGCGKKFKRSEHLRAHMKIHESAEGMDSEARRSARFVFSRNIRQQQQVYLAQHMAAMGPGGSVTSPGVVTSAHDAALMEAEYARAASQLSPLQQLLLTRLFSAFSNATPSSDPHIFAAAAAVTNADLGVIQKWYGTQRSKARALANGTSSAHVKKYRKRKSINGTKFLLLTFGVMLVTVLQLSETGDGNYERVPYEAAVHLIASDLMLQASQKVLRSPHDQRFAYFCANRSAASVLRSSGK